MAGRRHLDSARSIEELLARVADEARALVGAHQAAASLVPGGKWTRAVHAVSLGEKYAAWRAYDELPEGSGIYHLVCTLGRPLRLTQQALEAHPAWRGFGRAAGRHPPMRGWLAVPLTGAAGRSLGLVQVSDPDTGEFSAADEAALVRLARTASAAIATLRDRRRADRRAGRQR